MIRVAGIAQKAAAGQQIEIAVVAVRSVSIAWSGSANNRMPARLMPRGGLMIFRAAPA